jgi:protoporphyrinogen/coproporphyrinogen III oxidase
MSGKHVAIIGGGITGLSAAWYLQQGAADSSADLSYTLLEQSDRWGGKIRTEHVDGQGGDPFVIEAGPDSFLTQKPWALQLARELGLGDRLLGTNDAMRRTFVLHKGRPIPLPDGVQMIVPTRFVPFALSPLLSPLAKLRMGMDLFIPPKRDGQDETLAEFITRRLGREALDKIAEPMMSGIYNAEAERQSLLATFPRFRELEEKHGSLIRGMLAARHTNGGTPPPENGAKPPSVFVSFQAGLRELVEALTTRLTGDLRLITGVEHITRREEGGYRLSLNDGTQLDAAVVIITTPAYAAADLLRGLAPQAADQLTAIRYVSTGTLSLAFRRAEVAHPLHGFGLLIPRSENRPINAITWTSTKFDHRAPADHVLLRVFFGGSRRPEMIDRDDDTLLAIIRGELKTLMDIEDAPVFHRIYRWHKANPQYDVGHLGRVSAIENNLPSGVYVTGSAYRGIGIPDCVHQAQQTIQQVFEALMDIAKPRGIAAT